MLIISKSRIPVFPAFSPLTPQLYNEYQVFLSKYPQHCDFSLNNLLIWFGKDKIRVSRLKGNLVLRIDETIYSNQLGNSWHTILGDSKSDKALNEFFRAKLSTELVMVPDYFVNSISKKKQWVISEDINNRDYILNIPTLLQRNGKLYENFRYQISYFLKNHSADAYLRDLDLIDHKTKNEVLNCLRTWRIGSFAPDGNDSERVDETAIKRLLDLQPLLPVRHRCIGLFIEDEMVGFSIFHVPHTKYLIGLGNHIKFDSRYKRMFDFLVFATASRLYTEGIQLLNAEQDMGVEGIRHHKKYLNPDTFYRKYSIAPKC